MKYSVPNRDFALTEDEDSLLLDVVQHIWAGDLIAKNAAYCCGYNSFDSMKMICASTLYHSNRGLSGRKLRKAVQEDFGISVLLILQLIVVISQIVYWIKKLLEEKKNSNKNLLKD